MKPEYIEILSPEERLACIKMGAAATFAEHGVKLSDVDGMVKSGQLRNAPGGLMKAIMAVSVLGGIPLGIAGHTIHNKITEQRSKELEMQEKIKYFQEASRGLEAGLAGPDIGE